MRPNGLQLGIGELADRSRQIAPGGWLIPEPIGADLQADVSRLDLSARVQNVFTKLKIRTVQQLLEFQRDELLRTGNFGRKSLAEVQFKLLEYLSGKMFADSLLRSADTGTRAFVDQLLSVLPERQRNVVQDRYGLWDCVPETLQDIGDKMGVTRERIRQIEASALRRLRQICDRAKVEHLVREKIARYLEADPANCGVLSDDEAVVALADGCSEQQSTLGLIFLQDLWPQGDSLVSQCLRQLEEGVFCLEENAGSDYTRGLALVLEILEHLKEPVAQTTLIGELPAQLEAEGIAHARELLQRVLAISPSLALLQDGTVALARWSEFRRRNAASLSEAALRVIGRPAHFTEIDRKIQELFANLEVPGEATIHNALVRRPDKFVWIKSGTYGLKAWGLQKPPFIKERLMQLLSEVRYPLPYWHLEEKVLEVCNCKEGSVRMTLDLNPRVFKRFEGDQYGLRGHYDRE